MADREQGLEFTEGRLQTYNGWQSQSVRPEDLAAAGFIYQGKEDEVICVCCRQKLKDWEPGDSPMEIHRKLKKNCRLAQQPEECEGDKSVVQVNWGTTARDAHKFDDALYVPTGAGSLSGNKFYLVSNLLKRRNIVHS